VSIIRVGATKKYSDGWDAAFGKGKKKSATAAKAKPAKKSAKKAAGKKAVKKKK
jgi:hypothetical protein